MQRTKDSIGRNRRRHREYPFFDYQPNEREVSWLQFGAMIGGQAPTSYFHQWTADEYPSYQYSVRTAMKLFRSGWFERDIEQERLVENNPDFPKHHPYWNKTVHRISKKAIQLLKDEGLWSDFYPNPKALRSWYSHQIFSNCVRGSLLLDAVHLGIPVWSEHTLLERVKRQLRFNFKHFERDLIPDGVMAVEIDSTRFLCFIECDRGTEQLTASKTSRKTWQYVLEQYISLFDSGLGTQFLDFDATVLLLNITTGEGRARTMARMSKGRADILHLALPQFSSRQFKPTDPVPLLTIPWMRSNGKPFAFVRDVRT